MKGLKRHEDFLHSQYRRGDTAVNFTLQDWKDCVIYFGGECAYCGATTRKGERLTKDHLVPISCGGTTTPDNIVPSCAKCNHSKDDEDFKDWFMRQSFFSQERLNRIFKWRTMMRQVYGGDKNE